MTTRHVPRNKHDNTTCAKMTRVLNKHEYSSYDPGPRWLSNYPLHCLIHIPTNNKPVLRRPLNAKSPYGYVLHLGFECLEPRLVSSILSVVLLSFSWVYVSDAEGSIHRIYCLTPLRLTLLTPSMLRIISLSPVLLISLILLLRIFPMLAVDLKYYV